jgi:hypothetical protein
MPLVIADRVRETTTTTGTGTLTLAGPYNGFQAFSVIGNGNTTYYAIIDAQNGAWEVGIGAYTSAGNTLSRATVLASSNAGALVNFTAGTKDVILTQPAGRSVLVQEAGLGLITGVAAFTANGIPYANATNTLTTSSGLTFNGTALGVATLDVTNVRALDATASFSIANTTGVMTIDDTKFTLQDNADTTKKALFELSGITTGTTRTYTLPNLTGTLATTGTLTQSFSGQTTFSGQFTLSSATNTLSLGTSQTSGTMTIGGTAGTGTITLGRSTAAQTINIGTGVNTAATKTINIGTGSTGSGVTSIAVGPTDAASQVSSTGLLNLNGLWTAKSAVQGENGFSVENSPTGAFIAPASVAVDAYTATDDALNYTTPYLAGSIVWTTRTSLSETATLSIKTAVGAAQIYSFYADPAINSFCLGTVTSNLSTVYGLAQNCFALGGGALTTNQTTGIPSPIGVIAIGGGAGEISVAAATTPTIGFNNNNILLGGSAGSISSAGGFSSSIGGDNVFIGPFVGRSTANTVAAGIGDANIFIGYTAGNQTDKVLGNNNIGIGYNAGSNLPGGRNNVVVIGGDLAAEASAGSGDVLIGNGSSGLLFNGTWSSTAFSTLTFNANNALTLSSTGGLSFFDSEFRIIDNTDTTKVAAFDASGITTATTRTYTLPNASGTLALLSGTQTFSGTTTFSAAVTMSGTTVNYNIGTSQSTGTLTMGGTTGTGTITVGRSTGAQTLSLAGGATTSGTTKTVDIGTAGVSGSITNINIGSAVAGALGTISINEQFVIAQPTPASISTTATLTNANIQTHIINTTGTSYTVTMPLGTTLETLAAWASVDMGYDFSIINTASGTITMAVNTGVTSLGGLTIATGISAQFRIRRNAANTFVMYRLS